MKGSCNFHDEDFEQPTFHARRTIKRVKVDRTVRDNVVFRLKRKKEGSMHQDRFIARA
jgi:hypothetical protein